MPMNIWLFLQSKKICLSHSSFDKQFNPGTEKYLENITQNKDCSAKSRFKFELHIYAINLIIKLWMDMKNIRKKSKKVLHLILESQPLLISSLFSYFSRDKVPSKSSIGRVTRVQYYICLTISHTKTAFSMYNLLLLYPSITFLGGHTFFW